MILAAQTLTVPAGAYGNAAAISYSGMGLLVASGGETATSSFSAVSWVDYGPHGRVLRASMGAMPDQVAMTDAWDEATGRLVNESVDKEDGSGAVDDITYTYTASGQITSATDARDIDGGGTAHTDRQCYANDYLGRLTTAWTSSGPVSPASPGVGAVGACTTSASSSTLSGPAPYWTSYSYDLAGNRTGLTEHPVTTSGTATSTNSVFGVSGHVHALATTTTGSQVSSYGYDAAGRTASRTVTDGGTVDPAQAQSLSWTPEGKLASVRVGPAANPVHTVAYGYGPDGGLVAQTLDGVTTSGRLLQRLGGHRPARQRLARHDRPHRHY